MRQLYPWRAVPTKCGPQTEDHSARLEEGDLVVGLLGAGPAERFIELASPLEVPHPERHETDALFHAPSMARQTVQPKAFLTPPATSPRVTIGASLNVSRPLVRVQTAVIILVGLLSAC